MPIDDVNSMNLINQPLNVCSLLQGRSTCAIEQAHESNDPC